MRRSRSKTSIGTLRKENPFMTEFSMAQPRSRFQRLYQPSVSASFLCLFSFSAGLPSFFSRLWAKQSYLPCSLHTYFLGHSFRRLPCIGWEATTPSTTQREERQPQRKSAAIRF